MADNGNTAFHYACQAKKEDVVDLIIGSAERLKIELQLKNNDGITGLDMIIGLKSLNVHELQRNPDLKQD